MTLPANLFFDELQRGFFPLANVQNHNPEDFNNIAAWLKPKLAARRISIQRFSALIESSNSLTHAWFSDRHRPSEQMMKRVCELLTELPVVSETGLLRHEPVHLREGLAQYTVKKRGNASAHYTTKVSAASEWTGRDA